GGKAHGRRCLQGGSVPDRREQDGLATVPVLDGPRSRQGGEEVVRRGGPAIPQGLSVSGVPALAAHAAEPAAAADRGPGVAGVRRLRRGEQGGGTAVSEELRDDAGGDGAQSSGS